MSKVVWYADKVLKVIGDVLPEPAKEIAENIATDARSLVPVKSGALRGSIDVLQSKYSDGGYIVTAGGGDQYYAGMVELGTERTEAKPYMRPAAEVHRHKAPDMIFGKRIKDALKS